jgi:hypothetical protein
VQTSAACWVEPLRPPAMFSQTSREGLRLNLRTGRWVLIIRTQTRILTKHGAAAASRGVLQRGGVVSYPGFHSPSGEASRPSLRLTASQCSKSLYLDLFRKTFDLSDEAWSLPFLRADG